MRIIRRVVVSAYAALAVACGNNPVANTQPPPAASDPPKIACPASLSVPSPNGQPIPVSYGSATVALGKPPVVTSCSPASGSLFPLGTTTVTCTATDAAQRTDTCTLSVTVAAPPKIGLTRFDAFGDSITWGEDGLNGPASLLDRSRPANQVPIDQTYPGALRLLLASQYPTQAVLVQNDGSRGERAEDPLTLVRFQGIVNSGSYQAVLIMEGSNDVDEQSNENGNTAPVDAAFANIRSMIEYAKYRNVRPYLATIPPQNQYRDFPARRGVGALFVAPFNDRLRALASAEGITLVDVHAAFMAVSGWETALIGSDGEHPTVQGYALIARTFLGQLKSTLEVAATPTMIKTSSARR